MDGPDHRIAITPTRRTILRALLEAGKNGNEVTVGDLADSFEIPHTTVYDFLRTLLAARMLDDSAREDEEFPFSTRKYYILNPYGRTQASLHLRLATAEGRPQPASVRITPLLATLLHVLNEAGHPLYGMEITRISGYTHGVVYPRLKKLARWGWARSFKTDSPIARGAPPRIYYEITPTGRSVASQLPKEGNKS
jgi:DNA-binding PadR family transcriptional regulator